MTAQQTHEKNLAWIDERIDGYISEDYKISLSDNWDGFESWATKSLRANRKVLERHGPDALNECPVCIATWENGDYKYKDDGAGWVAENYPCSTTTDITEGLGISE